MERNYVSVILCIPAMSIGATSLWVPCDASPPTLENVAERGDEVYLVPSKFCHWLSLFR